MHFGAVRVWYDVEEVVVHGSSWEVVVLVATVVVLVSKAVHDDGSRTWPSGEGTCRQRPSWYLVLVVVHGRRHPVRYLVNRRCTWRSWGPSIKEIGNNKRGSKVWTTSEGAMVAAGQLNPDGSGREGGGEATGETEEAPVPHEEHAS